MGVMSAFRNLFFGPRPEPEYDEDLAELVFGPQPEDVNENRFAWITRVEQTKWETYAKDLSKIAEVADIPAEFYRKWGMGDPVVWEDKDQRIFVSFPFAHPARRYRVFLPAVLDRANKVVFEWQIDVARTGGWVVNIHPLVQAEAPGYAAMLEENRENAKRPAV